MRQEGRKSEERPFPRQEPGFFHCQVARPGPLPARYLEFKCSCAGRSASSAWLDTWAKTHISQAHNNCTSKRQLLASTPGAIQRNEVKRHTLSKLTLPVIRGPLPTGCARGTTLKANIFQAKDQVMTWSFAWMCHGGNCIYHHARGLGRGNASNH